MRDDPTEDLAALRDWRIVFADGRRYQRATIDAWLEDPTDGVLRIETELVQCEIPIADIGLEDHVFEAGGIRRQIRVFRLPDENPHRTLRLERRIGLAPDRDNALYVCITQEDGHFIWSSPIYVFA